MRRPGIEFAGAATALPRKNPLEPVCYPHTMKLGVTEFIDCAHFLPGHPKCGPLHGHTYKIELMVEGEAKDGMVIDFADLKQVLGDVLDCYDHRSLNDFLEYPSVENICELLSEKLKQKLAFPFTLRVWEGQGKWAEI
jgi:6-pyruvoyltetrahydropterin/6-carboxytetrahydropterin synthase